MAFDSKKNKILYLTDGYAKAVSGIKISLFYEMQIRGFNIVKKNVHSAGINKIDGKKLLKILEKNSFTDLWVAHTWVDYVGCTLRDINKLGINVLGFGFSDPYDWNEDRLKNYNLYATHSKKLHKSINVLPTCYFTTCCDLSFHKDLSIPRTTDILFIGCGIHPRFKKKNRRITMVKKLLKIFPDIKIFGKNWPGIKVQPPISGNKFLHEINSAKISFDIEEDFSPLAHRNFEFPACGTPIITKSRYEVSKLHAGFPTYNTFGDLVDWINMMLTDKKQYRTCKKRMFNEVTKKHTIRNRVDKLLNWLDK